MKIGIFSKCGNAGGSEFRCAELANGIVRYTPHQAYLLCEGPLHPKVLNTVGQSVSVRFNVLKKQEKVPILYEMDAIVVVNSDSDEFTDIHYWRGEMYRHTCVVDLSRVKRLIFLFNFVIEPAAHLPSLFEQITDVRIITANTLYFQAISDLDLFKDIRHLPRLTLASPIDPESVSRSKKPSSQIRIGQYSMPYVNKFNMAIGTLVTAMNDRYPDRLVWHFMGMPWPVADRIAHCPNVVLWEPFAIPVRAFLEETDVFLFYPTWDRLEPWARSVAEALMSGSPVVATARGGNCDQVVHGNNGFLCQSLEDFVRFLSTMVDRPDLVQVLGRNASLYSTYFRTEYVIQTLMAFLL